MCRAYSTTWHKMLNNTWQATMCHTPSYMWGLQRTSSLRLGRPRPDVSISAGHCPMPPPLPTPSQGLGPAVLSTGGPRTGPGWRGSNNVKLGGWVTARGPAFTSYAGLRRAEKFLSLACKSSFWHWVPCGCRKLSPKGCQPSQLDCRAEWCEAREPMRDHSP